MKTLNGLVMFLIGITFLYAIVLMLGGCAVLPNTIAPEFEHVSHATQHAPFTTQPTDYGAEIVQVTAQWDFTKRFYLNASEGINLDKHYQWSNSYGEIMGPREQFTARVGYKFTIH